MPTPTIPSFQGQSDYIERTTRVVPGLRDMHRMAGLLLAERIPEAGRVLVLGAGGGSELKAFAEMHPTWHFTGIDPSNDMLELARLTLGPLASQVEFHEGTIDIAPDGLFDGATCLLTLHFMPKKERIRTLAEIHKRLKPGAPLVVAHHSFPNSNKEKEKWLGRFATYWNYVSRGSKNARTGMDIKAMKESLPVLAPTQDEAALRKAGFTEIELFYAALTFKGWIGYRSQHV